MSCHYEIRKQDADRFYHCYVLIESHFPLPCFESLEGTAKRVTFDTRGGARNYIKKHDITGVHIAKVCS